MALHKDLTGTDLHEPKGQAAAAVNTVYVADGVGSGTHKTLPVAALDLTTMESPNSVYVFCTIPDVSTASAILVPVPQTMSLSSARLVLGGAITAANATVTFTRNDAASMGSQVVAYSASAEGVGFTFTPVVNQTVTGPGYLKITTDGGSTDAQALFITLKFTRIP